MREIEHGTSHGYNTRRCRCDRCRAWMRISAREKRLIKTNPAGLAEFRAMLGTYGEEYRQFVADDISVEVVQRIKDEMGIPLTEIAKQAQCDYTVIHALYHGRNRNSSGRIKWETAARIYGAEGWFEAEREAAHDGA